MSTPSREQLHAARLDVLRAMWHRITGDVAEPLDLEGAPVWATEGSDDDNAPPPALAAIQGLTL